jgi:electron transfer flavoprotein beta subunit
MKIVVLVKQVPEIALIKVDEAANEVVLPQGPGTVNPHDEYAVEEALRIKEKTGGTVSVISVGPERTDSALRACMALGVDDAYILCDESFVGSDSQAVGRILVAGIKKIDNVDLILAGKQAIDSDSAQVPAVVAALMDLPQAMFVRKFESIEDGKATVQRTSEEGYDLIELSLPAVVSVVKEINEPRLPSLKGKMGAKKKTITTWTAADLGIDSTGIGRSSQTKTIKVSPPPPRPSGEMIQGETPEEIAANLFDKLKEKQVL